MRLVTPSNRKKKAEAQAQEAAKGYTGYIAELPPLYCMTVKLYNAAPPWCLVNLNHH